MSVLENFSLRGKVALVTGGAGIYGRHIVSALAEAGARVYLASRDLSALEEAAQEHRANGRDVTALSLDQSDEASVLALKEGFVRRGTGLDVLVNNAVLRPMKKGFLDSAANFSASMAVNATGLFLMTRAFGDLMAQNGRGSIINIGSIQGMVGPDATLYEGTGMNGFSPDYFFHKGGLLNFTRFTASYYGPHGVRCNCVSAGGFLTGQHPDFVARYAQRTLLGRMADSEDLQGVIVFLASDASRYITGANIPVDGGYTAN